MLDEALKLLGLSRDTMGVDVDVRSLHGGAYAVVNKGGGGAPTIWLDPAFFGEEAPPDPLAVPLLRAAALLHEMSHKRGFGERDAYILTNCFIHYAEPLWRGWFFSEKYKPCDWDEDENIEKYCAKPKYRDWQDYLM